MPAANPPRPRGGDQLPQDWDAPYAGTPPWDIGRPQQPFVELAEAGVLRGTVVELGCGTGEHTLLAAEHGCAATGVDISPAAIARARAKAQQRELPAQFVVDDALNVDALGATFDVVLDCGFYHVLSDGDRTRLAAALRRIMAAGSRYHLLCFSDRVPGDAGPRRIRQDEIRATFDDGFSVDSIEESWIEATFLDDLIPAWLAQISRDPDAV